MLTPWGTLRARSRLLRRRIDVWGSQGAWRSSWRGWSSCATAPSAPPRVTCSPQSMTCPTGSTRGVAVRAGRQHSRRPAHRARRVGAAPPALGARRRGRHLAKLVLERAVKVVVTRERPGTSIGPDVHLRGEVPPDGESFVSGHAVLVAALACLVTPYLTGRWKAVPWAVLALVLVARVTSVPTTRSTWCAARRWASPSGRASTWGSGCRHRRSAHDRRGESG